MAIEHPLDSDAVSAADDRFYEAYPEMIDENGDRIPLSAQNDPNNDMHEDWVRFYKEELAGNEEEDPPEDGPEDGNEEEEEGDEEQPEEDDDDSGELPPAEEDEDFPTEPPDPCQECADSWISLDVMYAKDDEDCTGVHYAALLTDQYLQPTTGTEKREWDPIPEGTCLFGEFDFHKPGANATMPEF